MVKVTVEACVLALKDIGSFLATWQVADIKTDTAKFCYALSIFCLINVPSDLLLMNHVTRRRNSKREKSQ